MDVSKLSSEELFALAEKKRIEEQLSSRPCVTLCSSSAVNNEMINLAESYMKDIESGREVDTEYAFELLMKLVYGEYVFEYINTLS